MKSKASGPSGKFSSENVKAGTGPGRSCWWPWQAPPTGQMLGFPSLFNLIFWKFHSIHFCRLMKWQAFLLNTECLCNHKHKLVFYLGISIWGLACSVSETQRSWEKGSWLWENLNIVFKTRINQLGKRYRRTTAFSWMRNLKRHYRETKQ